MLWLFASIPFWLLAGYLTLTGSVCMYVVHLKLHSKKSMTDVDIDQLVKAFIASAALVFCGGVAAYCAAKITQAVLP